MSSRSPRHWVRWWFRRRGRSVVRVRACEASPAGRLRDDEALLPVTRARSRGTPAAGVFHLPAALPVPGRGRTQGQDSALHRGRARARVAVRPRRPHARTGGGCLELPPHCTPAINLFPKRADRIRFPTRSTSSTWSRPYPTHGLRGVRSRQRHRLRGRRGQRAELPAVLRAWPRRGRSRCGLFHRAARAEAVTRTSRSATAAAPVTSEPKSSCRWSIRRKPHSRATCASSPSPRCAPTGSPAADALAWARPTWFSTRQRRCPASAWSRARPGRTRRSPTVPSVALREPLALNYCRSWIPIRAGCRGVAPDPGPLRRAGRRRRQKAARGIKSVRAQP